MQHSKIADGLHKGYLDASLEAEGMYTPQFVTNDFKKQKKVLTSLEELLTSCSSFKISVAFITTSGIASLRGALDRALSLGIKGQILTSTYLTFTDPVALKQLQQYSNITIKVSSETGFHAKGYLFEFGTEKRLLLGSSNFTQAALSVNKEWNLLLHSAKEGSLIQEVEKDFDTSFDNAEEVTKKWLEEYSIKYNSVKKQRDNQESIGPESSEEITPNLMQESALESISQIRAEGKTKALLISATGTGKTYLSALDVKAFKPKKFLFVVHRLNIAKKAMKSFQNILGKDYTYGIYSGQERNLDAQFIFSTVQTISKGDHLNKFDAKAFDYIVIDETHRAGAESYKTLMNHFKPKFLLGMTATPERTDGWDVFNAFDYNIAYEIRLQEALHQNMLVPFHYFGITDLTVGGETLDEKTDFKHLSSDERLKHIFSTLEKYGSDRMPTRGLVFCSNKQEARFLETAFNEHGLKAKTLTADTSESARQAAIESLESNKKDSLNYIITVDIFNEGIDIPSVNQVVMLRPTQSSIVFVQQLGRGLRKSKFKEYLTVIDFIGNYNNNYLIPIALFGDKTYNKDNLRNLLTQGNSVLPGASTVSFDEITEKRIFQSIDSSNLSKKKALKEDYHLLKYKIGRIPKMEDFQNHNSRDPFQYVKEYKNYPTFLTDVEGEYKSKLTAQDKDDLGYFAREVFNGLRGEEHVIFDLLQTNPTVTIQEIADKVKEVFGYTTSEESIKSAINSINLEFATVKVNTQIVPIRETIDYDIITNSGDHISWSPQMKRKMKNPEFSEFLIDNANAGKRAFIERLHKNEIHNGFVLYSKYSRKDVLRLLNWPVNVVAQNVGGYKVSPDGSNCPIFVNYHKADDISSSINYEDKFLNPMDFQWMSKNKRKLDSPDIQTILKQETRLPLFVKKSNGESDDFYYMGDVKPLSDKTEQTTIKNDQGKNMSIVKFVLRLTQAVDSKLYRYLHKE